MQQNAEDAMMPSYKNLLILNTTSTHDMSCNESFVYDIEEKPGVDIKMLTRDQNELKKKVNFQGLKKQQCIVHPF